jgi:hypothetical protein
MEYDTVSRETGDLMKRKLCPFDKSECVGELCMLFSEKNETCCLVLTCSPVSPPVRNEKPRPSGDMEHGGHERKSRFKAELFD